MNNNKKIFTGILFLIIGTSVGFGYQYMDHSSKSKIKTPIVATNTGTTNAGTGELSIDTETGSIENESGTGTIEKVLPTGTGSEFVLITGMPVSALMQNTLVSLYNKETGEFVLFPYSYYVDKVPDTEKKDTALAYLESGEIEKFFLDKGINIVDTLEIDRDKIFDLFKQKMNEPGKEYTIKFKSTEGKDISFPIKTQEQLFTLASKGNLSNWNNLENIQFQLLQMMTNENYLKDLLGESKVKTDLYNDDMLSIVEKTKFLEPKTIDNKAVLVDKDYGYLIALSNGTISTFKEKIKNVDNSKVEDSENKTSSGELTSNTGTTSTGTTSTGTTTSSSTGTTTTTSTGTTSTGTAIVENEKPKSMQEKLLELRQKRDSMSKTNTGTTSTLSGTTDKPKTAKERLLELRQKHSN